ncbi:MAG: DUF99 family protein [Desulfurococcales archaeon]|nr:DUF99 family protein [Desulfurococcales archaeon]
MPETRGSRRPNQLVGVGCDDGRVTKLGGGWTSYACISMKCDTKGRIYPLDVVAGRIRVDGLDASSVLASAISMLEHPVDVVFLDSVTIAGFNVASPSTISRLVGAPVIVVYTYKPCYTRLAKAASKLRYFEIRERVLRLTKYARKLSTSKGDVYVIAWGLREPDKTRFLVECFQLYARKPEPVRVAHFIASSIYKFIK